MIIRETEKRVELRTLAESISLQKSDIERRHVSKRSLMPEGLLQFLNAQEIRDLVAYLQSPKQVPLPSN